MTRNQLLILRIDKMLTGYVLQTRWIQIKGNSEWHLRGAEQGSTRQQHIKVSIDLGALYVTVSGNGDLHDLRMKWRRAALTDSELAVIEYVVRYMCVRASVAKLDGTRPVRPVQAVVVEGCV